MKKIPISKAGTMSSYFELIIIMGQFLWFMWLKMLGLSREPQKLFFLATQIAKECTVQCSDEIYYCALLHQYGIYVTSEA